MKRLLKQINILNLLLAAAVLLSLAHWPKPGLSSGPETSTTKPASKILARFGLINGNIMNTADMNATDSPNTYSAIAAQNLFHPDRIIPVEKPAQVIIQPPPKPVLVLHGTLIMGDLKLAYIEVQKTAQAPFPQPGRYPYPPAVYGVPGRPLPNRTAGKVGTYRKGDSIQGFVITSIEPDKVILARGAETMEIYLSTPITDLSGRN